VLEHEARTERVHDSDDNDRRSNPRQIISEGPLSKMWKVAIEYNNDWNW
jgi:hypothetical protein